MTDHSSKKVLQYRKEFPQRLKTLLKDKYRDIIFDFDGDVEGDLLGFEATLDTGEYKQQFVKNPETKKFELHNFKYYNRYYIYGEQKPKTLIIKKVHVIENIMKRIKE